MPLTPAAVRLQPQEHCKLLVADNELQTRLLDESLAHLGSQEVETTPFPASIHVATEEVVAEVDIRIVMMAMRA